MERNQKKNVLFIEEGMGFGGAAVSLYQIVSNLKNYNAIIVFYAPEHSYFLDNFKDFQCIYLNIKFTYIHKEVLNRFLNRFSLKKTIKSLFLKIFTILSYAYDKVTLIRLVRIIKNNNIEVIHSNNTVNKLVLDAARLTQIPCVCHLRGHVNTGAKPSEIECMSYLIAPTQKIAKYANKVLGINREKIKVLYNTINIEEFECPEKRTKIREQYNIREETFVISMFARIRPMKGQILLTEAMSQLLQKNYDVVCMFVGDASDFENGYLSQMEKFIHDSGFNDRFIFTGYQAGMPGFYAASDIVVHPSISDEAFGRIIIESWAAKKPILASDIEASVELIDNEQDGLIVPKGSPGHIAKGIMRLVDDSNLRLRLVSNGGVKVRRFQNQFLIEELETIYEELTETL